MEEQHRLNIDTIRRLMIEAGIPRDDLARLPINAPVWDTEGLTTDFEVLGFAAPFAVVRRRADRVKGTLEFVHQPRVYFNFVADD